MVIAFEQEVVCHIRLIASAHPYNATSCIDAWTMIGKKVAVFHVMKYNNNKVYSFVSRCGHLWCRSWRFDWQYVLLVFIRRWGWLYMSHLLSRMAIAIVLPGFNDFGGPVTFDGSFSLPISTSSEVWTFLQNAQSVIASSSVICAAVSNASWGVEVGENLGHHLQ